MGHGAPQKAYVYNFTLYIYHSSHCTKDDVPRISWDCVPMYVLFLFIYHEYLDVYIYIYICTYFLIPGTQMTFVLIGKDLILE